MKKKRDFMGRDVWILYRSYSPQMKEIQRSGLTQHNIMSSKVMEGEGAEKKFLLQKKSSSREISHLICTSMIDYSA